MIPESQKKAKYWRASDCESRYDVVSESESGSSKEPVTLGQVGIHWWENKEVSDMKTARASLRSMPLKEPGTVKNEHGRIRHSKQSQRSHESKESGEKAHFFV